MSGALMSPQGGFLGVTSDLSAAGAAALTATFIGFGDAANELTGDANLTWINGTGVVGINRVAGQTADADFLQYDGLVTDEAVQAGIRWTVDGSEASVRAEWTGVTGNAADGFQLRYTAPDHFFQSTNAAVASTAIHVVTAASEYVIGLVGGVNQLLMPTDSGALAEVDIAKSGDVNTGLLWSAADELQAVAAGGAAMTWDATNTTVERGQLLVQTGTTALPGIALAGFPNSGFRIQNGVINAIAAGSAKMNWAAAGVSLLSAALLAAVGTGTSRGLKYSGDTNTGWERSAADEQRAVTAGVVRMTLDAAGNSVIGTAAVATTAMDGFMYITSCPGLPTGVATTKTGRSALVFDSTNERLYADFAGTWFATGPKFDSIVKTITFADFAAGAGNQEFAFDSGIPAGALVSIPEFNFTTGFSGGGANNLTVWVTNSNYAGETATFAYPRQTVTGWGASAAFSDAWGNILAGDTPIIVFDPNADDLDNMTAGSVTVTIKYIVP